MALRNWLWLWILLVSAVLAFRLGKKNGYDEGFKDGYPLGRADETFEEALKYPIP